MTGCSSRRFPMHFRVSPPAVVPCAHFFCTHVTSEQSVLHGVPGPHVTRSNQSVDLWPLRHRDWARPRGGNNGVCAGSNRILLRGISLMNTQGRHFMDSAGQKIQIIVVVAGRGFGSMGSAARASAAAADKKEIGTGIGFRIARAHQWCIMRRVAQTAGETVVSGVLTLTNMQGI